MSPILNYLAARFSEASTLRGLVIMLAGLAGYELSDDDAITLLATGQILASVIGAAFPDTTLPNSATGTKP